MLYIIFLNYLWYGTDLIQKTLICRFNKKNRKESKLCSYNLFKEMIKGKTTNYLSLKKSQNNQLFELVPRISQNYCIYILVELKSWTHAWEQLQCSVEI